MTDLDAAFARALKAYDGAHFSALTPTEQTLVAIWALEADVNNGGFDQFYFNSHGHLGAAAGAALEAIGAIEMAAIVEEANARFGPGGPPEEREARQERLLELTESSEDFFGDLDRRFWGYPDDIAKLLRAHLER